MPYVERCSIFKSNAAVVSSTKLTFSAAYYTCIERKRLSIGVCVMSCHVMSVSCFCHVLWRQQTSVWWRRHPNCWRSLTERHMVFRVWRKWTPDVWTPILEVFSSVETLSTQSRCLIGCVQSRHSTTRGLSVDRLLKRLIQAVGDLAELTRVQGPKSRILPVDLRKSGQKMRKPRSPYSAIVSLRYLLDPELIKLAFDAC